MSQDRYIEALKELISDIEAMQSGTDPDWFGDFFESQEQDNGTVAIEWPNLAISVEKAQKIVAEYEATNPPVNNHRADEIAVMAFEPDNDDRFW